MPNYFKIKKKSKTTRARVGVFSTKHGIFKTPAFLPIATRAAVKTLSPADLTLLGADIILSNTYHLWLRPGPATIVKHDGLHKFMQWPGPILTDSGGFQIFSLAHARKVTERGVYFKDDVDGTSRLLTPEKSVAIQESLQTDIAMVFDHLIGLPAADKRVLEAMERTTRWAARSKQARTRKTMKLFGIVQGGLNKKLRQQHAQELIDIGFDGYAIGGLAVGETEKQMYRVLEWTTPLLPENRPRYLMGVGLPQQIVAAVSKGIDMFDCVIPSRHARHGLLYVWRRPLKKSDLKNNSKTFYTELRIKQKKYAGDIKPLDETCGCYTCQMFSRSYLRHIFITHEPLAQRLLTIHNLYFYLDLMRRLRRLIK